MCETKVVNKIKTHFLCSIIFLNRALLEIRWRDIVDPNRPQMAIWRMCVTCWYLSLRTHPLRICMILIAYPLRQRLKEHTLLLRYTYIAWVVCLTRGMVGTSTQCGDARRKAHIFMWKVSYCFLIPTQVESENNIFWSFSISKWMKICSLLQVVHAYTRTDGWMDGRKDRVERMK